METTSVDEDAADPGRSADRLRGVARGPFIEVLKQLNCSLLVSAYHAGKLLAIGHRGDDLVLSLHSFDMAMGIAVREGIVAVCKQDEVAFLTDHAVEQLTGRKGQFDRVYMHRRSAITGPIGGHEIAWVRNEQGMDELWVVNTVFSCLSSLHERYSFVPRWRPPFISKLQVGDRCHLNGLAMRDGRPAAVTAMSQTDTPRGWHPTKNKSGVVLDIASGQPITGGLAMPHSPRFHNGSLYVLNSGRGQIETVDVERGTREVITELPGFTRGLALQGNIAFVGLSRMREKRSFGGLPLEDRLDELRCGVAVVDLDTGTEIASLEFESLVEEIFDVQLLAGTRCVALRGESKATPEADRIWVLPPGTA